MTLTSQFAVKRSNAGVHLLGKNYIPEKKCGDAKWLVTGAPIGRNRVDEFDKSHGPPADKETQSY